MCLNILSLNHQISQSKEAKLFFGFVLCSTSKKVHSVMWWYFLPNNWQLIWQKIDIQFATVYWIFFYHAHHTTPANLLSWVEKYWSRSWPYSQSFFFGHGVHNLERIKNILWVRWWSHFFGMRHCSTPSHYK